ncbi:MAG: PhoH family protein, partial [Paraclostridium sp.]
MIIQKRFEVTDNKFERELFGNFDENIKIIESNLNIDVLLREGHIVLIGQSKNINRALEFMNELYKSFKSGKSLDKQSITYAIELLKEGKEEKIQELEDTIIITKKGREVKPKTLGQKQYINFIRNNDITLGVGPAGTGKTYLAVAMAVRAFKKDEISRIILTR